MSALIVNFAGTICALILWRGLMQLTSEDWRVRRQQKRRQLRHERAGGYE